MILTGDNLLRFVKEKKAVTPTMVSEVFETSTMIASAALSDLANKNLIGITYLKLASSPYYYDLKQSSILVELGEKHLKGHDRNIFLKLKEQEVINSAAINIPEKLAIEKMKDFAKELNIEYDGKIMKFWVWYQRDIIETKKQILEILGGKKVTNKSSVKKVINEIPVQKLNVVDEVKLETKVQKQSQTIQRDIKDESVHKFGNKSNDTFENKVENYIENYFKNNYLKIESKQKFEKGIAYDAKLIVNKLEVDFDCFYFFKKPTDIEIIKFYSSTIKPKIIFIQNIPKKIEKLSENLENLTIINI